MATRTVGQVEEEQGAKGACNCCCNTSTIYGLKTNLTFIKLPNTHKHNFYAGRTLHVATLHCLPLPLPLATILPSSAP